MGLDVYLYPAADAAANKAHNDASNAFYDRPDYEQLTEDQRKELRAAIPPYVTQKDVPSERYPDHLFNRRYLRSSYNGGGFNNAVPQFVGSDHGLYWIFEPMNREWDGDDGMLSAADVPLLAECRKRAEQVAGELRECDPLSAISVSSNVFAEPQTTSKDEALAWARATLKEPRSGGWWSNLTGEFFGESGPKLIAACPGRGTFGEPAVHLVYRAESDAIQSYIQSAEITVEFIDEAVSLIERDGTAQMSWSG